MTVGGVAVDLSKVTGYAGLKIVSISGQNGRRRGHPGVLHPRHRRHPHGTFTNGAKQAIAQIVLGRSPTRPACRRPAAPATWSPPTPAASNSARRRSRAWATSPAASLEMSNVDLSQEFTNLIVAQRGFQANARIITTCDEVLQELTNLKR